MFKKPTIYPPVPALVALAGIVVLAAAFAFQHLGGYMPCKLCIYQRWPFAIVIVLSLAAYVFSRGGNDNRARVLIRICGLVFLVGASIAVYHVGVEEAWWPGPTTCSGIGGGAGSIDELMAMIETAPVVRCDEVQWRLFGISMAGYNVFLSLGLGVFCLFRRFWAFIPSERR